jgi:hypothetical protein
MRKEEQKLINEKIIDEWEKATIELRETEDYSISKLRSCSASVITTNRYHFLKSYNTIIAFIDKNTDTCYDVLRFVYGYTSTSAQHIAKFKHDFGYGKFGCTSELRYYDI